MLVSFWTKLQQFEKRYSEIEIVSDIAIFVLKRDVKIQLTNSEIEMFGDPGVVCKADQQVHIRLRNS